MDRELYYRLVLSNNINNNIIQYNRNISNCITLLKIIESYNGMKSCNARILKYINRIFQNQYKIKDTNSIQINYNNKEIYSNILYQNSINNIHNNIKIDIFEEFSLKNNKNSKIKDKIIINKNDKNRTNNINYINNKKIKAKYNNISEFRNFNKFINNIYSIINKLIKKNTKSLINNKEIYEMDNKSDSINDIIETNILI